MANKAPVTAQDLEDWLSPAQVLGRATVTIWGETEAKASVWKRVTAGLIRTFASRTSVRQGRHGTPLPKLEPTLVTAQVWNTYNQRPHHFWRGEAEFTIRSSDSYRTGLTVTVYYFDIRLDPADVDREFPIPATTGPPQKTEQQSTLNSIPVLPPGPLVDAVPPPNERPVAEAHLLVWADMFRAAYPNGDLDLAWRSAKGAFPDKHVARQRVRDLLGPRPRGRPRNK
jgi:hypothetical protein